MRNVSYLNLSRQKGTTDVTRTWHFGKATKEFREVYTRVLKGNIGVDNMIFPENTPGFVLDVLARQSLWKAQKGKLHYIHIAEYFFLSLLCY